MSQSTGKGLLFVNKWVSALLSSSTLSKPATCLQGTSKWVKTNKMTLEGTQEYDRGE